jgi:thioredoxin reductase
MTAPLPHDVVVIGGGPAGLAAATWLGRYRRDTVVVDAGRLRADRVEHSHGYLGRDPQVPRELVATAREQMAGYSTVTFRRAAATGVSGSVGDFRVTLDDGTVLRALRLVLATGVADRFPPLDGFEAHYGADVFHCPACDGYDAQDRDVVAYGWDERLVGFATTLLNWARSVTVVTGGRRFAGDEACCDTLAAHGVPLVEEDAVALVGDRGDLRAVRLASGRELSASRLFFSVAHDPRVDLAVRVPRVDLARLLATAGLDLPAQDLGWASLTASVAGPLLDPAALRVDERLDFTPPARPLPSIERLKGPFDYRARSRDGTVTVVRVGPDSPDFIPLADVPPLFLRTLLIGEDANFYGHPGIDLKEIPVALADDLATGTFARGASTISQQVAKNLFLSRARTVSRKLEELALALLLDSRLGKSRLLEIYVNVIEWGPHLYGLRPAARHYFDEEPAELTPKQMAFLVSLVPGPLKYQRSFAGGTPTPFLEGRMATLLAKLNSVGALSDDEYARALDAPLDLRVAGASAGPPGG